MHRREKAKIGGFSMHVELTRGQGPAEKQSQKEHRRLQSHKATQLELRALLAGSQRAASYM